VLAVLVRELVRPLLAVLGIEAGLPLIKRGFEIFREKFLRDRWIVGVGILRDLVPLCIRLCDDIGAGRRSRADLAVILVLDRDISCIFDG